MERCYNKPKICLMLSAGVRRCHIEDRFGEVVVVDEATFPANFRKARGRWAHVSPNLCTSEYHSTGSFLES